MRRPRRGGPSANGSPLTWLVGSRDSVALGKSAIVRWVAPLYFAGGPPRHGRGGGGMTDPSVLSQKFAVERSAMSQVLQCTQFSWWMKSFFFPGSIGVVHHLVDRGGTEALAGVAVLLAQRVEHRSVSATTGGRAGRPRAGCPLKPTRCSLLKVSTPSNSNGSFSRFSAAAPTASSSPCGWGGS